jgi:hypothetical protein
MFPHSAINRKSVQFLLVTQFSYPDHAAAGEVMTPKHARRHVLRPYSSVKEMEIEWPGSRKLEHRWRIVWGSVITR